MNEFLPRPDLPVTHVLDRLRDLINGANNTRSAAGNILIHRDTYLAWVSGAESQLRNLFSSPEVWQGLHASRYGQIVNVDVYVSAPPALIHDETVWQAARLQAIYDDLKRDQEALGLPSEEYAAVVPDTNVFLHYEPYYDLKWPKLTGSKCVRLVVPLLVIDQLDDLSFRSRTDTYERAKGVIKSLRQLRSNKAPEVPVPLPKQPNVELLVMVDRPAHVRRTNDDDEILTRAEYLTAFAGSKRVYVVAGDYGMQLRAGARNLQSIGADKLNPRK